MPVELGDVLPGFAYTVTSNATGALVDPTTFTVTLTDPSGAVRPVTLVHPAAGLYTATYVADLPGRWTAVGTATGNGADGARTLVWDVEAAAGIISLADAKSHLGVEATSNDDEIAWAILVASELAERITDKAMRRRTLVETYAGGGGALLLRHSPVLSVTSVTEDGTAASGWVLDGAAGVLWRSSNGAQAWGGGVQGVTVTYVVGMDVVPAPLRHGVRELVRHLWESQRGGFNLRGGEPSEAYFTEALSTVPKRIWELLNDRGAGF